MRVISSNNYWQLTLQLFIKHSILSSRYHTIQPSLAEFLSLTVELLRQKSLVVSNTHTTTDLHRNIATALPSVLSLLDRFPDVFIAKKIIDVFLKLVEVCTEDTVHALAKSLKELFQKQVLKSVVYDWMKRHAEELEIKFSGIPQGIVCSESERELVDIAVRKTVILVLESVARFLSSSFQCRTNTAASNSKFL